MSHDPSDGASKGFEELLRTAGRLQAEVSRVRDELEHRRVEGESGGGLVRCAVSGTGDVLALTIDPALVAMAPAKGSPADEAAGLKMIEDLVVAAVNQAIGRAREVAQQEMARVTGGLPMPPGLPGS
jgi:DNA-binding YbaB/EbfC family protein